MTTQEGRVTTIIQLTVEVEFVSDTLALDGDKFARGMEKVLIEHMFMPNVRDDATVSVVTDNVMTVDLRVRTR